MHDPIAHFTNCATIVSSRLSSYRLAARMEAVFLCEEVDDVRNCITDVATNVADFVEAVSCEFIDYPYESKKQHKATYAVNELEKACRRALDVSKTIADKNKGTQIRAVVAEAKDKSSVDIITYQHAMLKYNRRKAEYAQCNPLTRGIISPRASPADIWREPGGDEEGDEDAEVSFILIAVIAFVIVGIGFVASSYSVRRRMPTHLQTTALSSRFGYGIPIIGEEAPKLSVSDASMAVTELEETHVDL